MPLLKGQRKGNNGNGFKKGHPVFSREGCFKKGMTPWNKDRKCPEWTGAKSVSWKGEKAGYIAKHMWIGKHYGKAVACENQECSYPKTLSRGRILTKATDYEWANISGEYKRDRGDWMQLCTVCHRRWDRGLIVIVGIKKSKTK